MACFRLPLCSYCNCVISIGKERLTLQREAQTRRLGEWCIFILWKQFFFWGWGKLAKFLPLLFGGSSPDSKFSDVLLRVLLMVQTLLQENRHGSKRDIYYMHPTVFKGIKIFHFCNSILVYVKPLALKLKNK